MTDEFEVLIEKIVAGGDGLARREGRVVFVPGTAPGERHRVQAIQEKRDYVRARSVELLEASEARRSPPCPYYASCGGCALMHLTPEAQLGAKKAVLTEGLERSSRTFDAAALGSLVGEELGYRNRLRFHVVFVENRPIAGFRKRGSHEVVDVDRCLLGTPSLNECWQRLRRALHDRRPLARSLVSVELEESTHEPGRIAARLLVSSVDGLRWLDGPRREELLTEVGLDGMVVGVSARRGGSGPIIRSGRPFVEHRVSGLTLRQSVGSFFQSNRFLLEDLVAAVIPRGGEGEATGRGLDLYSGVGLFALPLSRRVSSVVGVETETVALRDARANAELAGLRNVRFVRGDAPGYASRAKLREDDVVILDPPRGGVAPELLQALGASPLRALRYVSCDPPALFRDVARLEDFGFGLQSVTLVDLFPNTHHFECLAFFERSPAQSVGLAKVPFGDDTKPIPHGKL